MNKLKNSLVPALLVFSAVMMSFSGITGYQVGDKVTDFSLRNVDGNMVSLADFKDAKGFIVVFTCNHCPYAKMYEDRIIALNAKYASKGYPVIAINPNDPVQEPDDSFEEMVKRAKEKGFTFPYLFDEGQQVLPQFGATKTPHAFVLKKSGSEVSVEYIGAIDNNTKDASKADQKYVEMAVDALMKGEKPAITTTKAIGCSIKVKK